jgi:hypothetical protein
MTVSESIESAFADVPYPGDDRIADHQNCPECDDVREHFRGATWRGHNVAELQQYQSVLPLFTPEALQYFFPAFMLVSLGAWCEADDIPSSILYMCLPSDPSEEPGLQQHQRERFEIFTRTQRKAIADYLREWANSDAPFVDAHTKDIQIAIERLISSED